jgi:hypothetical protein
VQVGDPLGEDQAVAPAGYGLGDIGGDLVGALLVTCQVAA